MPWFKTAQGKWYEQTSDGADRQRYDMKVREARDAAIYREHLMGTRVKDIAKNYGMSKQNVFRILKEQRA